MSAIKPLVDELIKLVDGGIDIVKGQLPDVANQILRYAAWSWTFALAVSSALLLGCIVSGVKLSKHLKTNKDCECGFYWILILIAGVPSVLGFCCSVDKLMQIHFAPRIFLFEYVRDFVKGGCSWNWLG